MAKNKFAYDKSQFERQEALYVENLTKLEDELVRFKKSLKSHTTELPFKKGKFNKIKPEFEYEDTKAWKEYINKTYEEEITNHINDMKAKIAKAEEVVLVEKTRLNLIRSGVPAWEPSYDNQRLLEESSQ
jgi:hypothetical protein